MEKTRAVIVSCFLGIWNMPPSFGSRCSLSEQGRRGRAEGAHTWPGILQRARTEKGLKLLCCENIILTKIWWMDIRMRERSQEIQHLWRAFILLHVLTCLWVWFYAFSLPKLLELGGLESSAYFAGSVSNLYNHFPDHFSPPSCFLYHLALILFPPFLWWSLCSIQPCCNVRACSGTSTASQGCIYCGELLEEVGKTAAKTSNRQFHWRI